VRRARLTLAVATLVSLATLAVPATAAARVGAVELRLPGGRLLASLDSRSARYPENGAVLKIGSTVDGRQGVVIRDVSLLAGRIRASSVVVPAEGLKGARVTGLTIDGVPYVGKPNTLVPLAGTGYLVVLQAAVVPGSPVGVTGLRLHLSRRLGELPAGADLTIGVAAAARPWARATTGPLGFNVPTVGAGESSIGERAAGLALQYLGVPYLWGGANPKVGLDCSGLTMLVYKRLGIKLAHFTGLQWQEGVHVGRNVEPGDLVFFHPTVLGPGHVGIYLGGGRFIQAPHTGDVVKISSLRSAKYALTYVGAVRPY
jgi:NlpC/P60 family